jgi:ribonuclease P protein component
MLPKRSRLSAQDVAEVLKEGKSLSVGPYRGKFLADKEPLRVAVIVPKKGVRHAVERNRLRRAAYRELPAFDVPKTGRLAIFVRR